MGRPSMPKRAQSVCECGHEGDGPDSQHLGVGPAAGHGRCTVPTCRCEKFTWARFNEYGERRSRAAAARRRQP